MISVVIQVLKLHKKTDLPLSIGTFSTERLLGQPNAPSLDGVEHERVQDGLPCLLQRIPVALHLGGVLPDEEF